MASDYKSLIYNENGFPKMVCSAPKMEICVDDAVRGEYFQCMFIREIRKKLKSSGSTPYEYVQHRLVESIRTENGPRQHTLLNLGTLPIPAQQFKTLANLIEANLTGCGQQALFDDATEEVVALARHYADIIIEKRLQKAKRLLDEGQSSVDEKSPPVYETVDTNSILTSASRTIGAEHIALSQLRHLDFFDILQECGFSEKQQAHAGAQICARMVHPASERETARWLRQDSACGELLDADFSKISDQNLHQVSDMLLTHKDYIEQRLSETSNDLFSLENKIILYDLTNTYFESPKRHSGIIKYGRSKEKRNDCPQITLALVVDALGFPKRSRILEGGISEPKTLWDILEMLEDAQGSIVDKTKTVVIDAGIATEENLAKLREDPRFEYVAVSRKSKFDEDIFRTSHEQTLRMNHDKQLLVKSARQGDETFLLCKSPDRSLKDEAIFARRKNRFEEGLKKLNEGLQKPRTKKDSSLVYERIGRLKERYKIGQLYTITVSEEAGVARAVSWQCNGDNAQQFGEYLLRTTRNDLGDEDISLIHRTLTMIESAFRWLKSDLGLRPNFHQKDARVKAHATMSVLAYFALAAILNKLQWGGTFVSACGKDEDHRPWLETYGWKGLVRTMSSQTRVTTSFNCKDGSRIDARTTVEPRADQLNIYKRLQVNPRPLKRLIVKSNPNVVPKNNADFS
jgi:transposase